MNWYEVEYSGGNSSQRMIGMIEDDLFSQLTSVNPPTFIEIKNMTYFSYLSKKYELYNSWNSKWTNEVLICVKDIITVRKLCSDILESELDGESDAFSKKLGLSIAISKTSADKNRSQITDVFVPALNKLMNGRARDLAYSGNFKFSEQQLLPEGEFVVKSYGSEVIRDKVAGDYVEGVLREVNKWIDRRYALNTEDEDDE